MSTVAIKRNRLAAFAVVAAVVAGGAALTVPDAHAGASGVHSVAAKKLCWYKGSFYQDGRWWDGMFAEPC